MYNVLGATGSGSSPSTSSSSTLAAYQTPHFDVDAYYRPSPQRYGQTHGLSQIRENFTDEHTPENIPIGGGRGGGGSASRDVDVEEEEGDDEEEDLGRHQYSRKETFALYNAWVNVSYDPIVGNQLSRACFWEKVTEAYNSTREKGVHRRNLKMLRNHFDRYDRDVKIFCEIYRNEAANYQSGDSGADILRTALRVFKDDTKKDFKHVDVWASVKDLERWACGVPPCTGMNSKRTKHAASGQYSSSEGGSGNTSQEVGGRATYAGGSSGS